MRNKTDKSDPNAPAQKPADVAREAFRQLAMKRIAPTPDAFRTVYNEIIGITSPADAATTPGAPSDSATVPAIQNQQAQMLREMLNRTLTLAVTSLLQTTPHLATESEAIGKSVKDAQTEPALNEISSRLKQLCYKIETNASRAAAADKAIATKSTPAPGIATVATISADDPQIGMLRDLLARTLTLAVASLLQGVPELADESESLGLSIANARTPEALSEASNRLKQLCFKIELKSGDMAEQHEMLLRLFKLLLENVSELLDEDSWLNGQVAGVQNLLAGPISHAALKDATRSLKEVIYKQGALKHSLAEAKVTVKNMMITFIDRLSAVAVTTGDYHEKIDKYSQQISQAQDISELNSILDDVMRETRIAQNEALRSRDDMIKARKDVQEAEARVHELETKLEQMSELVREDQLTGSLNRRGLDDVFEREFARADRRASPLCVAMLDLDDFKRLNDTHGHLAGDQALIYLVRLIKDTLRTMDVIARFGGEEFLIVLPDTPIEEAMQTVTRLQRELTKRIFMHNNERLLITFSAGVALRGEREDQAALIKRADAALYQAKKAGKNRVVSAE